MKTINLLSYNFMQKPILISSVPNEFKSERVELFGQEMKAFDIIALQELFEFFNPRVIRFIELAQEAGFTYIAKSPMVPFCSQLLIGSGLCIVSRFPIKKSKFIPFDFNVQDDRFIEKGVLWAQIEMPSGNRLQLFTTHMISYFSYLSNPVKVIGHIDRIEEMILIKKLIIEVLEKHASVNDLTLLCGDFNVNAKNDNFPFAEVVQRIELTDDEKKLLQTNNEFEFYKRVLEFKNCHFSIRNVFNDDHGFHPITNGKTITDSNGLEIPIESLISDPKDRYDNTSLDYLIEILPKNNKLRGTGTNAPQIVRGSSKLEEFKIKHKNLTQLSDHFGLSAKLII